MSWGVKIAILYCSFVALIVSMVFLSMNQQVDMVTKNYYEQELLYQDRIDAINRTTALEEQLSWVISGNQVTLKFPLSAKGKINSGTMYFFRPSNEADDRTLKLEPDTSLVRTLSLPEMNPGFYQLKVNWKSGDQEYYNESGINI